MTMQYSAFGRIPRTNIALDPLLGAVALTALISVPFLKSPAAMVYLACGCLIMLRNAQLMTSLLLRYWPVLALPLFCTLSYMWSRVPGDSFRFGLQLGATFVVAIVLAGSMSARTFTRTLFWVMALLMVLSVVFGQTRDDTGALLGLYGSKNAMAGAAAVFTSVAASLAFGRGNGWAFRIAAMVGTLLGAILVVKAQSASAVISLPIVIGVIVAVTAMHSMRPLARILLLTFTVLFTLLFVILLITFFDLIFATLLDVTGKDMTLTGRTDLWGFALDYIAERPMLGIGYQAFWTKGHAPAEALWAMFGIASRSGFHFHNTYLSNAVEIGILGVIIQAGILFTSTYMTGLWAVRSGACEATLFFVLNILVVIASFVEVPIFFQFSLRTVMVVSALVFAQLALKEMRAKA